MYPQTNQRAASKRSKLFRIAVGPWHAIRLLSGLCYLALVSSAWAQAPQFNWATSAGGPSIDYGRSAVVEIGRAHV